NPVLQKIRGEFRKHTENYDFNKALEIGNGPGIDLVYFARKYPDRSFYGIDVSPEMVRLTNKNLKEYGLKNATAKTGSVEDIPDLFPGEKFDLIYVYFGGLNTIYNLKEAVKQLHANATPDATFVLTSVNRYYLMDFIMKSLKLKWREATARFRNNWKGYSPGRDLPSNVYSAATIKKYVQPEFKIIFKRGYSLFYPPWFGARYLKKIKGLGPFLWKFDNALQNTPLWNIGEYSLYVMKRQ
ncbi:MAG: class I SAM-dependent methyltransferase, partial [Bacteroidales bacterium]|nr:class I SAM-dependent methyltransferase [Bacteroidales bacterium]